MAHQYRVQYSKLVKTKLVLLQHGHALTGRYFHAAFVGLDLTRKNFQERGFAGTVGTNHAIAIALGKAEVHFIKQHTLAKGKGYIIYRNHSRRKLRRKSTIFHWLCTPSFVKKTWYFLPAVHRLANRLQGYR